MKQFVITTLAIFFLVFGVVAPSQAANDQDLINAISKDADISKAQAKKALDSLTKKITAYLKKGDKITLKSFGVFSVSKRAARTGRNPQTGATIKISAKSVVKFKAAKNLSKAIN
jgi:DNA-binding protein HU-beta